jgi:hypothetical protein
VQFGTSSVAAWIFGEIRTWRISVRTLNFKIPRWLGGAALLCIVLAACSKEEVDQKGGRMFGLFNGKKSVKSQTTVAAEVGAVLQSHAAVPAQLPPPVAPAYPACKLAHLRGLPPDGQWEPDEVLGETRRVYIVPLAAGQPPLAITADAKVHLQVWELSSDKTARFVKPRPVNLDAAQGSWESYWPAAAAMLPGNQVALSVGYYTPYPKEALYVYTPAINQYRRIGIIEPDMTNGPPFTSFETLAATPETVLVLYHTGLVRIAAEKYAYENDHIVLFSPHHLLGLEIVKLCIDDGNVRAWGMQGKTLWLQTQDRRKKPKDFYWSLDLAKVL